MATTWMVAIMPILAGQSTELSQKQVSASEVVIWAIGPRDQFEVAEERTPENENSAIRRYSGNAITTPEGEHCSASLFCYS